MTKLQKPVRRESAAPKWHEKTIIEDGKPVQVWTDGEGETMSIEERDRNRAWARQEMKAWGIAQELQHSPLAPTQEGRV